MNCRRDALGRLVVPRRPCTEFRDPREKFLDLGPPLIGGRAAAKGELELPNIGNVGSPPTMRQASTERTETRRQGQVEKVVACEESGRDVHKQCTGSISS